MREGNLCAWFCLLLLVLRMGAVCASPKELPGVGLDRTRVVYTEVSGQRGISFSYNNNSENDYLIQTWLTPPDSMILSPAAMGAIKEDSVPFHVLPPLVRLDAHGRQEFRLLRKQSTLPQDRESVFLLSVKAIPNTPVVGNDNAASSQGTLRVAMVSTVKLFYRPTSLPSAGIASAIKTLRFCRDGSDVAVYNPSPFYLTFSLLEIGKQRVEGDVSHWMIPPMGEMHYPLTEDAVGPVRWSLLDERGEVTPLQTTSLLSSGCGGLRK